MVAPAQFEDAAIVPAGVPRHQISRSVASNVPSPLKSK